jgi:hypothetical protein
MWDSEYYVEGGEIEILGRAQPRKRPDLPFKDVQRFLPFMDDVKRDQDDESRFVVGEADRLKRWENLPDNFDGEFEGED